MLNKNIFLSLYLGVIVLISQTVFSYATFFIALPLLIYVGLKSKFKNIFKFRSVNYLFGIFILGITVGTLSVGANDSYHYLRDIFYFIQAPFFIFLGVYLGCLYIDRNKVIRIIVISTFIITCFKLSALLVDTGLIFRLGFESRFENNIWNSSSSIVILIILAIREEQGALFNVFIDKIILYVSIFSLAVSFSRTNLLVLVLIYSLPIIRRFNLSNTVYAGLCITILFVMFGGGLFEVQELEKGATFIDKIYFSLSEITVRSYNSSYDAQVHWRGFEAHLGLEKIFDGNIFQIFFGHGFGTVVYTPYWIFSDDKLNVIPFFHNGYFSVLLKSGFFGLFLYFLFIYSLLNKVSKVNLIVGEHCFTTTILHGLAFIVVFNTLVIHGIYFTTPPVALLLMIGFSLGHANEIIVKSSYRLRHIGVTHE